MRDSTCCKCFCGTILKWWCGLKLEKCPPTIWCRKEGAKLTQAADASPAAPDFKWSTEGTTQLVRAKGESVASLLAVISADTDRPTYDKTGLTGVYDFALKFTPKKFLMDSPPTEDSAPCCSRTRHQSKKLWRNSWGLGCAHDRLDGIYYYRSRGTARWKLVLRMRAQRAAPLRI